MDFLFFKEKVFYFVITVLYISHKPGVIYLILNEIIFLPALFYSFKRFF